MTLPDVYYASDSGLIVASIVLALSVLACILPTNKEPE